MRTILAQVKSVTVSVTLRYRLSNKPRNIGKMNRQRSENPRVDGSIPSLATIFPPWLYRIDAVRQR